MWIEYNLILHDDFVDLGVPRYDFVINSTKLGVYKVSILKGKYVTLLVNEIIIPIGLNEHDIVKRGGYAGYIANDGNIVLGIWKED